MNRDYMDKYESEEPEYYYREGGYHPVTEGELFKKRYKAIKKLGWGTFSLVWMVKDKKKKRNVALKIQKSKEEYSESALDEINILKKNK